MLIIPLVTSVLLVSAVLFSLEAQNKMIRNANRYITYKAEQLRDHMHSEWQILERLQLEKELEYTTAFQKSMQTYAYSLLRSETEDILVFDTNGTLLYRFGLELPSTEKLSYMSKRLTHPLTPGWYDGTLFQESRIGVVFSFQPLDWIVTVTEKRSQFFLSTFRIIRTQGIILLASLSLIILAVSLYVGYITRPAENLAKTIALISDTHNLSHRAKIENDDEIGLIAERFNNMISALQVSQEQIERTRQAEILSRNKAVQSEYETLYLVGKLADFRDAQTSEHQDRISNLARLFASLLGMNTVEQEVLFNSARLHDIGKVAIPDSILLKPGKLTPEEFRIIETHTTRGFELLHNSHSEYLKAGAIIANTHHERWDGTGYPGKIAGENIPLFGRIVSILDVFDALISARPYKEPWPVHKARLYIIEHSGTQFDPALIKIFDDNFAEFEKYLL